jgi:outer membrane protein assembly factor BamE (lipoprotein component of BamABCDE complex)
MCRPGFPTGRRQFEDSPRVTIRFPRSILRRAALHRAIPHRAALAGCLLFSACSFLAPPPQVRGNHVEAEQLKELVPGTSTEADVRSLLGSPTAHASFDDNTWLYISERTQPRIGATLGVLSQNVVTLSFNDNGVLQHISTRDQANSLPVQVIARTTPSPGTSASFLQQLFGNIGRFNAAGLAGSDQNTGGGGSGSAGAAPTPY